MTDAQEQQIKDAIRDALQEHVVKPIVDMLVAKVVETIARGYILAADAQEDGNLIPYILCGKCGYKSYHAVDIRELYCGNCREFHSRGWKR